MKYTTYEENGVFWTSPVDDYGYLKPAQYRLSGKTKNDSIENYKEAYESPLVDA